MSKTLSLALCDAKCVGLYPWSYMAESCVKMMVMMMMMMGIPPVSKPLTHTLLFAYDIYGVFTVETQRMQHLILLWRLKKDHLRDVNGLFNACFLPNINLRLAHFYLMCSYLNHYD